MSKQETPQLGTKEFNDLASAYFGGKPKQETLEEVAKKVFKGEYICNGIDIVPAWREGFVTGAKWQQERMYSEEDMEKYSDYCWNLSNDNRYKSPLSPKEWFEQFKNK